jgi:ABC-type Fe3+/spermidine/putrescine transport system ATPase subunit
MAYVSIQSIEKRFAANAGVQDIDLTVERGEALCLLGESGCGKTTLLRLIAGLLTPDSGRIHLDGRDVTDLPTYRRDIGMCFQTWALFPHLSVWKNIEFGLKLKRLPEPERRKRVGAMLELVGLSALAQRMPRQLSGGQQQRVALARALATNPGLVLLDEPLSSLDFNTRLQLRQELRSLFRELGVTAIYVTHDYSEALAVADRTALMNAGRIVEQGPTHALFERPATTFSARFLGLHNVLPATVIGHDEQSLRVRIGEAFSLTVPNSAALAPPMVGAQVAIGFDQWSADLAPAESRPALAGTITQIAAEHGHTRLVITLDGDLGTFQHRIPGISTLPIGTRCRIVPDTAKAWRLSAD